ncbi:Zn-dependent exopeptidase [Macroventuria anomochaeta]|uniref:Zn-dependent exopeptidase n=1 Tax=Macroventuria anomochaeta TaxID=301207 RepID=A0ACB6S3Y0_9PLEO|nr:Zn-dependent exopeptidase [Macroventuria anomochaeta]KAF2628743.1 Zn-dependent exopeptidase [Macroventuria anomochaeta]
MDITQYPDLRAHAQAQMCRNATAVTFPSAVSHQASVTPLLSQLNMTIMETELTTFSAFYNRYYKSAYRRQAPEWLFTQVQDTIIGNDTIITSAHLNSLNLHDPMHGRAPGADDDGSGTFGILEALRVLVMNERVKNEEAENTIEFYWYAAEASGLFGLQAVDMVEYVDSDFKAEESFGVVVDFVNDGLTEFAKIISAYCTIPGDIHSPHNKVDELSFSHMLEHGKMAVEFAYELLGLLLICKSIPSHGQGLMRQFKCEIQVM